MPVSAAKTEYNEILANVDYLHGVAESFLTLTNLFIVSAFRKAVISKQPEPAASGEWARGKPPAASAAAAVVKVTLSLRFGLLITTTAAVPVGVN